MPTIVVLGIVPMPLQTDHDLLGLIPHRKVGIDQGLVDVRKDDKDFFKMEKPTTWNEQGRAGAVPLADVLSFPFGFDYVGNIEAMIKEYQEQ